VVFYVARDEDFILDCEYYFYFDIVINSDSDTEVRDYFAKFFIKEICVLGEVLHFNVEFVEQLWIQIPRFSGF